MATDLLAGCLWMATIIVRCREIEPVVVEFERRQPDRSWCMMAVYLGILLGYVTKGIFYQKISTA